MLKRLACVAGTLIAFAAGAARADEPTSDQDLRCFMLYAAAAGELPQESNQFAATGMAMFYFLGRLDARDPTVDWLDQVPNRLDLLAGDNIEAEGRQCEVRFRATATAMQAMGERMTGGR